MRFRSNPPNFGRKGKNSLQAGSKVEWNSKPLPFRRRRREGGPRQRSLRSMDVSWARPRIHSPNIHVREKITRKTEPERANPKGMIQKAGFSSVPRGRNSLLGRRKRQRTRKGVSRPHMKSGKTASILMNALTFIKINTKKVNRQQKSGRTRCSDNSKIMKTAKRNIVRNV